MQCNVHLCATEWDTSGYGFGVLFKYKRQVYCLTCRHICINPSTPVVIISEGKPYITSPVSYSVPDRSKDLVILKVLNHVGEGVQPLSLMTFDATRTKTRAIYDNARTRVAATAEPFYTYSHHQDADGSYWTSDSPILVHSKSKLGESGTPVYTVKGLVGLIVSVIGAGEHIDCPQVVPVSKKDILSLL